MIIRLRDNSGADHLQAPLEWLYAQSVELCDKNSLLVRRNTVGENCMDVAVNEGNKRNVLVYPQ